MPALAPCYGCGAIILPGHDVRVMIGDTVIGHVHAGETRGHCRHLALNKAWKKYPRSPVMIKGFGTFYPPGVVKVEFPANPTPPQPTT